MMRNRRVGLVVIVVSCLLITGCQKPAAGLSTRKAQIVGSENLQLKKDIADKDKQIAALTQQLQEAKQENEAIEQQHGDTYGKLLQMLADCETKREKLEAEE